MQQKQLKYLTKLLLKQKKEIEKQVQEFSTTWINELSLYDNHPADIASETYEMDKERTLYNHQKRVLEKIRESIKQINCGTYGICKVCKQEIPFERLEIIPYTNLCFFCAKETKFKGPIDIKRYPNKRTLTNPDLEFVQKLQSYGSSDNMQDVIGMEDYEDFYEQYDLQHEEDPIEKISNEDYKKQLYD